MFLGLRLLVWQKKKTKHENILALIRSKKTTTHNYENTEQIKKKTSKSDYCLINNFKHKLIIKVVYWMNQLSDFSTNSHTPAGNSLHSWPLTLLPIATMRCFWSSWLLKQCRHLSMEAASLLLSPMARFLILSSSRPSPSRCAAPDTNMSSSV